jgi:NADH:ubiquinone oxidoreductase subunit 6 (subunit J)
MDVSSRRGRGRRAALALAVLIGLLAAVAVASTGATPLGSGGARRPADQVMDVLASLLLVALVAGVVVWVALFVIGRDVAAEIAQKRRERKRGTGLMVAAIFFVALAGFVWWTANRDPANRPSAPPSLANPDAAADEEQAAKEPYEPRFALVPMLILGGLIAAALTGAYVSHRARRRHLGDEGLALVLGDVLDETLDDLRAEADPARAVIAAYARLERALAAHGLPRRPAEAPQEYVARVLQELEVGTKAVERLTALFVRAKFSQHEVGAAMKDDAIEALEQVREDLRAAEEREALARATALAEARERAAG